MLAGYTNILQFLFFSSHANFKVPKGAKPKEMIGKPGISTFSHITTTNIFQQIS